MLHTFGHVRDTSATRISYLRVDRIIGIDSLYKIVARFIMFETSVVSQAIILTSKIVLYLNNITAFLPPNTPHYNNYKNTF